MAHQLKVKRKDDKGWWEFSHLSQAEIDALIGGGNTNLHKHDQRYYTEVEVDSILAAHIAAADSHAQYFLVDGTKDITGSFALNVAGSDGATFSLTNDDTSSGGLVLELLYDESGRLASLDGWLALSGRSATPGLTIDQSHVFMGASPSNRGNITAGLSIQQGGDDGTALAIHNTDVNHFLSSIMGHSEVFMTVEKVSSSAGGAHITGCNENYVDQALLLTGYCTNPSSTVLGGGIVEIRGAKHGSGTVGTPDPTDNIFAVRQWTSASTISGLMSIKSEGTVELVGPVYINDGANAKMSIGLTINQGAYDDEILSFKSSDIAHGCTSAAETDTFGYFKKDVATTGGLNIVGLTEASIGLDLSAVATTFNTVKTSAGWGAINVTGYGINGASLGDVGANANIFSIRKLQTSLLTVFIVDEDGDTWQSGGATLSTNLTLLDSSDPSPSANQINLWTKDQSGRSQFWKIDDSGVKVNLDHDSVMIVRNASGVALTKGQLVYISGSTGNVATVLLARANAHTTLADGILLEDIADGGFGYMGHIAEVVLDTVGLNEGDPVYLDPDNAGAYIVVEPTPASGVYIQHIGTVTKVAGAGVIRFIIGSHDHSDLQWHGHLAGLGEDDHTQYLLADGSRSLTADWDAGAFTIKCDTIQATDGNGLQFLDDAGNLGVRILDGGKVGIGNAAATPSGELDIRTSNKSSRLTISTDADDDAQIRFYGDRDNDGGGVLGAGVEFIYDTNLLRAWVGASGSNQLAINTSGGVFIGDNANTKMTVGLTINQDAYDDEILAFKSSDIIHGLTTYGETDTYASFGKQASNAGGLKIVAIAEDTDTDQVFQVQAFGGTADTTKSTAGIGSFDFRIIEHDGANNLANITDNGNIFSIRCRKGGGTVTSWLLDEDGITYQTGSIFVNEYTNAGMTVGLTINQGAYDDEILAFKSSDVAHPVTDDTETDTYAFFKKISTTLGGLFVESLTDGATRAMDLRAVIGSTTPNATTPGMRFQVLKSDGGTGTQGLAETESTYQFLNASSVALHCYGTGNWVIGSNVRNAKMTTGLTINQAGYDNEVLALKSSDVAHLLTSVAETDTYANFQKTYAGQGGLKIRAIAEDNVAVTEVLALHAYGGQADTTKSTAGLGLINLVAYEHDSIGNLADITADGNILTARARVGGAVVTRWLLDEDGDTWQSGSIAIDATKKIYLDGVGGHTTIEESAADIMKFTVGGTALVYIATTGLGIGTATPEEIFQIKHGTECSLGLYNSLSGVRWKIQAIRDQVTPTTHRMSIVDVTGGPTEVMTFRYSTNRVGILQTDPGYTLDITGDLRITSDIYVDGNNLWWAGTGRVAPNTVDGADDEATFLCGGGTSSTARGAFFGAYGNEDAVYPGVLYLTAGTGSYVQIEGARPVFINDDANTKMVCGLTINQSGNDDEILAFKSSDVQHAYSDYTEVDTYGLFQKVGALAGGLEVTGIRDTDGISLWLRGITSETTPTIVPIHIRAEKSDGLTGITNMADGEPCITLANGSQEALTVYGGPQVAIANAPSYNTKMVAGLTINQKSADDEILALKSSDVAHGVTTVTETNTFAAFKKSGAATGGLQLTGFSEGAIGLYFRGVSGVAPSSAPIYFCSYKSDGADGMVALANTEQVLRVNNGNEECLIIWGNQQITVGNTDTQNTMMEAGITINQGSGTSEILAFKNSGIVHGVTDWAETDTYAAFDLFHNTAGGLKITTFAETATSVAFAVRAIATDNDTTKGTSAFAPILLDARLKAGTGSGAMGADANLVVIAENNACRWLVDEDGDTWQLGDIMLVNNNYILFRNAADDAWLDTLRVATDDGLIVGEFGHAYLRFNPKLVFVGDNANTMMTQGITLNQAAYDDEILAFKSSDVDHGITDIAETDTYAHFVKTGTSAGGLRIRAFRETGNAMALELRGIATDDDNTKSTAGVAPIVLSAQKKSGTTAGSVGAGTSNLVAIRNSTTTRWILDVNGDSWQSGDITLGGILKSDDQLRVHYLSVLDADGEYTGVTTNKTVGENVVFGDLLYYKSDGKLWKADANAAASVVGLYVALETILADASGLVLKNGWIREDDWNWTVGALLYVSAAATGDFTETPPSGSGDQVVAVGWAESADQIAFFPEQTIVGVA